MKQKKRMPLCKTVGPIFGMGNTLSFGHSSKRSWGKKQEQRGGRKSAPDIPPQTR